MTSLSDDSPRRAGRSRESFEPALTVFLASAFIMVVELVAGRLVSRYLGVSLYTWTSIIGVILAGMSLGNYVGGIAADRVRPRRALAFVFLSCALGCIALLPLNRFAGGVEALHVLAWPARIFAHVSIVFAGPAILLGAVTPLVAKMALDQGRATGRVVGNIFAWGAAGGILGTFLTGYWAVAWFGVRSIVAAMAVALGALGIYYAAGLHAQKVQTAEPRKVRPAPSGLLRSEIFAANATVFVSNAGFMIVELAAMRIVARHFGSSLYTWTSVIGIVLAGITMGNALGGRIADRTASRNALAILFALASIQTLATPAVTVLAEKLFGQAYYLMIMPWPAQTFLYSTVCFFLPSLFLGMISPMVVKLTIDKGRSAGSAVGGIYAWGAVGSIFGTLLAGFYLIALVGTLPIIALVALVLALTAFAHAPRTLWTPAWAAACFAAFISAFVPYAPARAVAEAIQLRVHRDPHLVFEDESDYTYIAIWRDPADSSRRLMYLDQLLHSKTDLDDPRRLEYDYEWIYRAVLDQYYPAPDPIRSFVIGGGGFTFPLYLELTRPGSHIEVAEIDPAVTDAAFTAFGLPRSTGMQIFNMDARNHVSDRVANLRATASAGRLDCVFGDSINDYAVPYHLTTIEFARQIHDLLNDDGIYLLNMIDLLDPGHFLSAVVATARSVFPHLYVFNTGRLPTIRDTFIAVISKRPLDLAGVPERIRASNDYNGRLLTDAELDELISANRTRILTDDYAPVENLLEPVVASHRKDIGELRLERARRFAEGGNFRRAADMAEAALEIHPNWLEAREVLASSFIELGQHEKGLQLLRDSLITSSEPHAAHYKLGEALIENGELEEGMTQLKSSVTLKPDYVPALSLLGRESLKAKNSAEAVQWFQRAVSADPDHFVSRYNLGLALAQEGQMTEAIAQWTIVLDLDPDHADGAYNLLLAQIMKADYDGAWAFVERRGADGRPVAPDLLGLLQERSPRNR